MVDLDDNICIQYMLRIINNFDKKKFKIMDNFKQKQLFELQINVNFFLMIYLEMFKTSVSEYVFGKLWLHIIPQSVIEHLRTIDPIPFGR